MASKEEEIKSLVTLFNQLTKSVKKTGDALEKSLTSKETPKTLEEIRALEKELSDLNTETQKLQKTKKQEVALNQKLASLRKGELDGAIKLQAQITKETAEKRKNAKASLEQINAYKKLTTETTKAQNEFKRLAAQYGITDKRTKKALATFNKLDDSLRKINTAAKDGRPDVGRYGLALQGAGAKAKSMALGIAGGLGLLGGITALAGGLKDAIGRAKEFEQANANLASVLGTTRDNIGALTTDAKRLGAATSFSASEVSGLQTEFAKLGFNEQEILNATEATLDLAAATGSDLGEAAAIAGATLGGFGLDASETQRVTDVMAKSFSTSALDMEKFKESMKSAAPAAKAVGVSIEDTTALLGTMSNAGISGSKAGNALKNTFINLNKAGLTLEDGFEKVNNSSDKLGAAVALVGKEAATSFLIMAEGVDETEKLANGLRNAGGAAEKMANEQLDTLEGSLKILDSAWEGFVLGLLSGEGAFSNLSRSIVEGTTALLGFLTAEEDAAQVSFETAKALKEEADQSQLLLDEYESLVQDGIEPTKEEKERLDAITLQLKDTLGDSVVAINAETGAFELNTDAVRDQIKVKRLSFDAEASQIASRLKGVQEEIKSLEFRKKVALSELQTRKDITKEAEKAKLEELKGAKFAFKFGASEGDKALKKAQEEQNLTQLERVEINKKLKEQAELEIEYLAQLEALNFSAKDVDLLINGIKKDEVEIIEENTVATKKNTKAKKEAKDTQIEDDIAEFNRLKALDEAYQKSVDDYLKGLDDKAKADKEYADLFNSEIVEEDIADNQDLRDKLAQDKKDEEAAAAEKLKREKELTALSFKILEEGNRARAKAKLDALKEEMDALKSQQSKFEELAGKGDKNAQDSIVQAQKKEEELRRKKEAEIKRAKQNEIILGGLKAYSNKAGEPNAVANTITDTAILLAALEGMSKFYHGTDDTGSNGMFSDQYGKITGVTHEDEQVWSKKDLAESGNRTRQETKDILKMYDTGAINNGVQLLEPQRFESNTQLIEKYDEMIYLLQNLPKKMPRNSSGFDAFKGVLQYKEKIGNRTSVKNVSIID